MMIILTKGNEEQSHELQTAVTDLLGDEAQVLSKGPMQILDIKDVVEETTREYIFKVLRKADGDESMLTLDVIKSLRRAYTDCLRNHPLVCCNEHLKQG